MNKYSKDELLLIWIDSFLMLEYRKKRALFDELKGKNQIKTQVEKIKDFIVSITNEGCFNTILNSANGEYFDYVINGLIKRDITAITIESENYPQELLNTDIPPLVLYAKGNIGLLNEKKFGVVGSRKSLPLSVKLAGEYTKEIIKAGFVPVTGSAEGIDKAVLTESLANGGKCISVIASGFDNVYPQANKVLLDQVSENGLILTEYPPDVKSMPYFFPVRNRIIAGLSTGVLIVSAGIKSGAIYTAEYAMEYGKDLFAIPYSVGIESGAGCNDLIKRTAILTDKPSDIFSFYGIEEKEEVIDLTDEEKEITQILKDGELHVDKICERINKKTYEIMPTLMALEIKGIIIKSGVNVYTLLKS